MRDVRRYSGWLLPFFVLQGCGSVTSLEPGADAFAAEPPHEGPCQQLVPLTEPQLLFETSDGSASGVQVAARAGGFDVFAHLAGERTNVHSTIAVRRLRLATDRGSFEALAPVVIGAAAHGPPQVAVSGDLVALCYDSDREGQSVDQTLAVLSGAEYSQLFHASAGAGSFGCHGVASSESGWLTTTHYRDNPDQEFGAKLVRWDAQGEVLERTSIWPPEAQSSFANIAGLGTGYALGAAVQPTNSSDTLRSNSRIELRLVFGDMVTLTSFDAAFGSVRTPSVAPWPAGDRAAVAVWREFGADGAFELRLAAADHSGSSQLIPFSLATSFPKGSPALVTTREQQLLVSAVLQPMSSSDSLQATLMLLDQAGQRVTEHRVLARDAIAVRPQAAAAALGDRILFAWTTSQPGESTFRWTEIHGQLLACR